MVELEWDEEKEIKRQRTEIKQELKRITNAIEKFEDFEELNSIRQNLHSDANEIENKV